MGRGTGLRNRDVTGEWTNLLREEIRDPHFFTRYYYVIKSWAVWIGVKKNTHRNFGEES